MKTKVKAEFVIGYDPTAKSHVIYSPGEVVFEDGQILYVGSRYDGEVQAQEDCGRAIISPGFVDTDLIGDFSHALVQSEMNGAQKTALNWCEDYFLRRKECMTPEEEAFKSLQAYLHGVLNGITTAMPITSVLYKKAAETPEETEAAMAHALRLGLRLYLSPSYVAKKAVLDRQGKLDLRSIEKEGEQGLADAVAFCRKYDGAGNGLIRACLTPERVEQMTPELLKETRRMADELNCPLRIHGAQSPFEYRTVWEEWGKSSVEYLADQGFLGPRAFLVHAIWTSGYSRLAQAGLTDSQRDLDVLRDTGSTVIHCPVVQAQSGTVLESYGRFLRHGIPVVLATDTYPPDMIQNIRVGSFLARRMDDDKPENSFANFFNSATCWAADALGRPDLGRLCPGAKADLIVIDLSGFHIGPVDDPIRTMALSCTGRDVRHSMINGRWIFKDRQFCDSDLQAQLGAVVEQSDAYFKKFKQGYLERCDKADRPEDVFQPSFPAG